MRFVNENNNHTFQIENGPEGPAIVERDFQGDFMQEVVRLTGKEDVRQLARKMGWQECFDDE